MNQISEILKHYLTAQKSSNALLITGEWGSGKTYFLNNSLKKEIKSLGFNVVYISLNGISSHEQVKNLLLSQSLIQGVATLSKDSIITKLTSRLIKASSDKNNILSNISAIIEPSNLVVFDKIVICFDDIERTSENYKIGDLFGLINSEYVEHKNYKVILIGDETKNQLATDKYKTIKEKLIGWTIEYKPNLKDSFMSIIDSYKSEKQFYDFLKKHQDFLIEAIKLTECHNLRSLIFFLDCLKKIISNSLNYSNIENELIYFTLLIVIEYKRGELDKSSINFVSNNQSSLRIRLDNFDEKEKIAVPDVENRFNKYRFSNFTLKFKVEYRYFESIYYFIMNGYLDEDKLKKEIQDLNIEREKSKYNEDSVLLDKIGGFPFSTNKELEQAIDNVISKINNGDFVFGYFLRACEVLFMVHNEGVFKIENLNILLENGIKKLESKTKEILPYEGYIDRQLKSLKNKDLELFKRASTLYENLKKQSFIEKAKKQIEFFNRQDMNLITIIENLEPLEICQKVIQQLANRQKMGEIVEEFRMCYRPDAKRLIGKLKLLKDAFIKTIDENKLVSVDRYIIREIIGHIETIEEESKREVLQHE